jgi:Spy/CpxP family protein refolding chaperone
MKRIAVLLLSLTCAVAATAQPRRGPGGPPPMGIPPRADHALADYLALTAAQQSSWETIQSELHASMRALHDRERELADQLRDANDAATIGSLVLQIRALGTERDNAKSATDAKFAALLTPEQQTKFAAFQAAAEFLRERRPPR